MSTGFGGGWPAPSALPASARRRTQRDACTAPPPQSRPTFRVDCLCGAWITCHATRALPATCGFCGRPIPAAIPPRLRALCTFRGLTAVALAGQLGLGQSTVSDWEAGRNAIPAACIATLAEALGVPARAARRASCLPRPVGGRCAYP
jgi:hypothetical protein